MMMNNKFTRNVDDKLEDALSMLAAGVPVAEILADAGDDADWLRPLLEIATEVGELQTAISVPSPQASLKRMLAYGEELAATSLPVRSTSLGWSTVLASLFRGGWLPRLATGLVSALLMVVLLGGTLTVLAQRSLPGQPLYSFKRAGEMLQLGLTLDSAQRDQLLKNYNQRRQMEAKLLLEQNQVATVDFLGQVEMVTGTSLTVDGLAVQLTPQTRINGNLAVGARVEVKVLTQPPDQLVALAVGVIEPAPPPPTPPLTPMPTLTLRPSPTATATRSLSSATDTLKLPTATPTDVPTNTPTVPPPSPTATSLPPMAPQPAATAIPPVGGNDNDNTNEKGNEDVGNNDNANDNSGGDNSGSGSGDENSGGSNSGGDDHSGSSGSDGGGSGSGGGGGSSGSGGGGDEGG